MDDDLNTADALAAIFELVRFANTHAGEESSKAFLSALKEKIVSLSDVLGLIAEKKEEMLDADIEALIEERQAARKARNFARADEIRNELLSKGIVLEDTREGVKWKRALMDLPEILKEQFGGETADIRTLLASGLGLYRGRHLRSGDPYPDRAPRQLPAQQASQEDQRPGKGFRPVGDD